MINKYISELLKTNTRVIVPDFGAFMVKSTADGVKQISFNDFLKYNDGLLVNYIVKQEGIVKDEALKKIKAFIEEIQAELKKNKPCKVGEAGYLYKDPRGTVRFKSGDEKQPEKPAEKKPETKPADEKPAEEKPKAEVKLDDKATPKTEVPKKNEPAIDTKNEVGKLVKKEVVNGKTINDQMKARAAEQKKATSTTQIKTGAPAAKKTPIKPTQPKTQKPVKKNNTSVIIISAAIIVVVGAAAVIGYLNWETVKGWFGGEEEPVVVVDSAAIKAEQAKQDSIRRAKAVADSIQHAKEENIRKQKELEEKSPKYYLVAGSFKVRKNAEIFVEKLSSEGYKAEIFMERRGFYRVSYNSYLNRNDAFQEYRRMKNQNIEVWVIRH